MALDLRPLLLGLRVDRAFVSYCEACGSATREGKRYCTEHVAAHPYARDLVRRLDQREADEEAIERHGRKAVRPDCELLVDLRSELAFNGTRTVERLSRDLRLSDRVVNVLVTYLVRQRVAVLGLTKRGSTTVRLVHPQRASA